MSGKSSKKNCVHKPVHLSHLCCARSFLLLLGKVILQHFLDLPCMLLRWSKSIDHQGSTPQQPSSRFWDACVGETAADKPAKGSSRRGTGDSTWAGAVGGRRASSRTQCREGLLPRSCFGEARCFCSRRIRDALLSRAHWRLYLWESLTAQLWRWWRLASTITLQPQRWLPRSWPSRFSSRCRCELGLRIHRGRSGGETLGPTTGP
mmetsp:Transcript_67938/g.198794  ORF Transcript_67938/g.198794 Transcript_67938/m.198794 type:complete len:206 (-) Transcript_67938:215-832(-)